MLCHTGLPDYHTFTFQILDKPRTKLSSLPPPVLAFKFYRAQGSAIPLLVDFSSTVIANSRSRVFLKSICAQDKVPTNLFEYAVGGTQTPETDQYQAGDNLIRHRHNWLSLHADTP